MGRFLTERIIVTGDLVVEDALHVGGSDTELFADMMLARNGAGKIYLPATSLAGPMRAWWQRAFGITAEKNNVWGPDNKGEKDKGAASLIRIEDAPVSNVEYSEIRDHVGIDRCSGTAADHIKYDREIVPAGTKFQFCLVMEIPAFKPELDKHGNPVKDKNGKLKTEPTTIKEHETLKNQLGSLLQALEDGQIRFGGGKTRGLGKAKLINGEALIEKVGDKDAVLNSLKKQPRSDKGTFSNLITDAFTDAKDINPSQLLTIKINWKSVLPVMMKDGRQGLNIDMIPLSTGKGNTVKTVLTGAGIKGVIRSHSERIVRTLQGGGEWDTTKKTEFDNSLAPDEIINRLYGAKGTREKKEEKGKTKYGMGAVFVDDCFPDQGGMNRDLRERLLTEKAGNDKDKIRDVMTALENNGATESFYPAQHNAIDRWLGGAADSALYSVLEPGKTKGTINITVDLDRIRGEAEKGSKYGKQEDRHAALALLLITLRDFKSGLLPIGFGVNRGLGAIEVESINFEMEESDGWPQLLGELEELEKSMGDDDWEKLQKDWQKEVDYIASRYAKKQREAENQADQPVAHKQGKTVGKQPGTASPDSKEDAA